MNRPHDRVRRATVDDVPQMASLAADRVSGEVDKLVENLTTRIAAPDTCAAFVVVEDDEVTARHRVQAAQESFCTTLQPIRGIGYKSNWKAPAVIDMASAPKLKSELGRTSTVINPY